LSTYETKEEVVHYKAGAYIVFKEPINCYDHFPKSAMTIWREAVATFLVGHQPDGGKQMVSLAGPGEEWVH